MVLLRTPIETHGENFKTVGEFTVSAGETVPFTLIYAPSHLPPPERADPREALATTETFWRDWTAKFDHDGPFEEIVTRSLITLKALTYAPTGGIVARRPRRCRNGSAASATGTTASAGCATPR